MSANAANGVNIGPLHSEEEIELDDEGSSEDQGASKRRFLPPLEVKERLCKVFEAEASIIIELFSAINPTEGTSKRTDSGMFFLDVLPVTASKFRPTSKGMGERDSDHPQNVYYSRILNSNAKLIEFLKSVCFQL